MHYVFMLLLLIINHCHSRDGVHRYKHLKDTFFENGGHTENVTTRGDYDSSEQKTHGDFVVRDEFICGVCSCWEEKSTSNGHISANCEHKRLRAFPKGLPVGLWSLRLSSNRILPLSTSRFQSFPNLTYVFMSSGTLSNVTCDDTVSNVTSQMLHLDLSSNWIKLIEDGSFRLMTKLKTLLLNGNKLERITSYTLQGLSELTRLDVSTNWLQHIDSGAFRHTTRLTFLNLTFNSLLDNSWKFLPPALVEPLQELKVLGLMYVARDELTYPNKTLATLPNLEELHIDGLRNSVEFGPELKKLRNLTRIHIGGGIHCSLKNISSTFFQNIPNIKHLYISHCRLMNISLTVYSKLNLTLLSLDDLVNYDLYTAFDDLRALQHSGLRSLQLTHLYHSPYPCRYLNAAQGKYIRNIALEELDLSSNRLALLGDDFLQLLPRTLKKLVLRENQFSLKSFFLNRIDHMTNLVELDMSAQNMDHPWTGQQQEAKCSFRMTEICDDNDQATIHFLNSSNPHLQNFMSKHQYFIPGAPNDQNNLSPIHDKGVFRIPPNLKVLNTSRYIIVALFLLNSHLHPNNSLTDIDFSESFLTTWGHGSLPATIQRVNLSNNFCKHIDHKFFPENNSVKFLDLSDNSLGSDFAADVNGTIFSTLTNTVELDISRNLIYKLSRHFFSGLKQLVSLRLSENKLQTLNSSFAPLKHLRLLDLSKNSIVWIDKSVRDDLDEIGENLSIDLTSNPLSCTCSSLEQIVWMMKTKIKLLKEDYLNCTFDDGIDRPIGNLQKRVQSLQRMCASKALVIVVCVALICLLGTVAGFVVIYRNRWKLRYIRNIAVAKLVGFKPNGANEEGFRFDAYILYTETTRNFVLNDCLRELEQKRGHKLCIADRNFLPGTLIISDIVSAVQNSSKTVPVSEPGFYADDEYSEYSVKMAIMEEVFKTRHVLHVLVLEPTPAEDMPVDLLVAMKRNSYTEFPPADGRNEELLEHFWDQLSLAIGHTANN